MKKILAIILALALLAVQPCFAATVELDFSTYLGGSDEDQIRDVAVDSNGNIFVAGGTRSSGLATTGAYQTTHAGGIDPLDMDAFIAKFSPNGNLLAFTYLGGYNTYERIYGIEIDPNDKVIFTGRFGQTTPIVNPSGGSFQTKACNSFTPAISCTTGWNGSGSGGLYGMENCAVGRFSNDLKSLEWLSFVGAADLCRDVAVDSSGNIYLPAGRNTALSPQASDPPAAWYAGSFDPTENGELDAGVYKISNDGTTLYWATWLGGSGKESVEASIRLNSQNQVHVLLNTWSSDIPVPNGADTTLSSSGQDVWVAQLSADGTTLNWATHQRYF